MSLVSLRHQEREGRVVEPCTHAKAIKRLLATAGTTSRIATAPDAGRGSIATPSPGIVYLRRTAGQDGARTVAIRRDVGQLAHIGALSLSQSHSVEKKKNQSFCIQMLIMIKKNVCCMRLLVRKIILFTGTVSIAYLDVDVSDRQPRHLHSDHLPLPMRMGPSRQLYRLWCAALGHLELAARQVRRQL